MNTFNTNRTPPFPIPTQVTRWQYGTTLATNGVATSNLLSLKIYPDDTPTAPDRIAYTRKPPEANRGFRVQSDGCRDCVGLKAAINRRTP